MKPLIFYLNLLDDSVLKMALLCCCKPGDFPRAKRIQSRQKEKNALTSAHASLSKIHSAASVK